MTKLQTECRNCKKEISKRAGIKGYKRNGTYWEKNKAYSKIRGKYGWYCQDCWTKLKCTK